MINQTMRILKAPLAKLSNCSSTTVSARLRNVVSEVDAECHGRYYASSVACKSSTVSKVGPKLSRDKRRALIESFVTRHRATNGGKFPSIKATHKEVGGSYYVVRDIFQELRLKSETPSVSATHVAAAGNDASLLATKEAETDGRSRIPARGTRGSSAVVAEFVSPVGDSDIVETETNQKRDSIVVSRPGSDKSNNRSDTPVIVAMYDELCNREAETVSRNDVKSKRDSICHHPSDNQRDVVSDACFKISDPVAEPSMSENFKTYHGQKVEKEACATTHLVSENPKEETKTKTGNLMGLAGQESKRDHIGESVDGAPLEAQNRAREVPDRGASTMQTTETRRKGSVWGNIMSLAESIVNFWKKG